jgi:hypothetical protein
MINGTRRERGVSVTPWPLFTPEKDPVPIVQDAGWAPGPVWTGAEKSRPPHRDSIPDHPARSQSLYWLSYPAHRHAQNVAKRLRRENNNMFLCTEAETRNSVTSRHPTHSQALIQLPKKLNVMENVTLWSGLDFLWIPPRCDGAEYSHDEAHSHLHAIYHSMAFKQLCGIYSFF